MNEDRGEEESRLMTRPERTDVEDGGGDIIHAVDRGPEVVAQSLAPQLGSDLADLASGRVDMRRFSVIEEEDIPFLIYAKVRARKSRVWRIIYDDFLNLKVSVRGLGRRQIIRMEGVSKGGMPGGGMESGSFQKPSWVERNFTNRDWKKKAERDMI